MAMSSTYYAPLIAAWNSTVAVSGVSSTSTGNPLTSTMLTAEKVAFVNNWAVLSTVPTPMLVHAYQVYNLILSSDFSTLSATNQQLVRDMLNMDLLDASAGTKVRTNFATIFTSSMATFTNLVALATNYDSPRVPWWPTIGLGSPVSPTDLSVAGLS